ncbi:Panacea domain-containing protein [Microvirga sp. CF3062]|uniref:Panacea domain-containing protein n=1 Tax=Microvirga sp. CF3062 TaxID=3110182 RepID=UPI002E7A252D|nr:Panacea domain-containing protein [Microvirga sp. CF3062]MEE1655969.1 Panacea domain-containing protein [Microvirga sp. CF3062]
MVRFIVQIPEWFPTRKAAQVTAFFADKAGGEINVLRATKLVYLADRLSMDRRLHPITGDNFVSMPFGPVNTYTLRYMNGEAANRQEIWGEFIGERRDYEIPLAHPITLDDLDELSRSDLKILEETWETFKDIDKYDLAEWTHKFCPEWRNPHGSSIPIDFATVYKRLGKEDPIELAEEIQAERSLVLELAGQH